MADWPSIGKRCSSGIGRGRCDAVRLKELLGEKREMSNNPRESLGRTNNRVPLDTPGPEKNGPVLYKNKKDCSPPLLTKNGPKLIRAQEIQATNTGIWN